MATQVYEDPQGNLMEEDPMQQRFRPGIDDQPVDAADVAASQSEATAKAAEKLFHLHPRPFFLRARTYDARSDYSRAAKKYEQVMERASEIGVRKAFGAPSLTLVGQFVVENVLLTLAGGVLALGLARVVLSVISAAGLIPYATFHLNVRVFTYALITALVFGLLSGVYPAWRMSRMHPVDALRGGVS